MESLGLPRGSVRAIIALVTCVGMIPVAVFAPAEGQTFYAALAGVVLRDYFHVRAEQNRADGPRVGEPATGEDS